jgi:hypothetical protein
MKVINKDQETKKCGFCKINKSLDSFNKSKSNRDGLQRHCRECTKIYHKLWYEKNKEEIQEKSKEYRKSHAKEFAERTRKWKDANKIRCNIISLEGRIRKKERLGKEKFREEERKKGLKIKYSFTIENYEDLFIKQNGVCAICGKPQPPSKGRQEPLYIDHDHDTGKVRGLLCRNCNFCIGHAHDDVNILQLMIKYLEKEEYDK